MTSAPNGTAVLTLDGLQGYLHEAFLRYYETAYELRDTGIRRERERLLLRPGAVLAEPFVELMTGYPAATQTAQEIFADLGIPEAAELVAAGLLPHDRPYAHQASSLTSSMAGLDVVVGTGTGSGKTEAFLLPVLARLVQESRGWASQSTMTDTRWYRGNGAFQPQRFGESGRLPGMRAMVLYPMNALVEDQMIRLRVALDSPGARAWFQRHRPGHRFYFGRYTGRTPLPGTRHSASVAQVSRLRTLMRTADQRHWRLLERVDSGQSAPESRYFLPSLDGAEMRSRWDMQDAVPDILITNYSMLSIALSRSDEAPMLAATRRWLEESDDHQFTLVVDELHMYRGTAGTEVAYLLRRLLTALGLDQRPDQLQVLATSASIQDDEDGRAFLSEFFGRPQSPGFEFIRADPELPEGDDDLSALAVDLLSGTSDASILPADGTVQRAFTLALTGADGLRPRSLSTLAQRVFPALDVKLARNALDRLLSLLGQQGQPAARLRGHLFARTLQGLWACSDPTCPQVLPEDQTPDRRIGALYTTPRFTCDCGSRVLELLYCQSCGESMLGGYVARSGPNEFLVSTNTSLDDLPDRVVVGRNAADYRVYWPTSRTPVVRRAWTRTGTRLATDASAPRFQMSFARARLSPGTGQIRHGQRDGTGYVYRVQANGAEERMPAFPTLCPACGDDWEFRWKGQPEDPQRSRSSIRTQGVGFDRANQVLTGALKRRLDSHLVVFSDSRQGAARVAANLELAHYLDLVRALVLRALEDLSSDAELLDAYLERGDRGPDATRAWSLLQAANPPAAMALLKRNGGMPLDDGDLAALRALEASQSGQPSLVDLTRRVEPELLGLGVNPAGPAQSLQGTEGGVSWKDLFNWNVIPIRDQSSLIDHEASTLLGRIRSELATQIVRTAFAGGHRDVESLGLAHSVPAVPVSIGSLPPELAWQFACSVLRVMARRRRVEETAESHSGWPSQVKDYAEAVAAANGTSQTGEGLLEALGSRLGIGLSTGFRLRNTDLRLSLARNGSVWRCETCRTKHLHASAGICVSCGGRLSVTAEESSALGDHGYYAWLATEDGGAYRLHCEELTGQTDPLEAQARQARFQGVFLDESELPLVDEVDVLSVTTTMEAGVDIGALKGVVMANMPPQRFNYQQRVGRAGRRSEHLSVALTMCRGARSHDEYYFAHPEAITGDPPPQPFLDTASAPILRRAFAAEVLTRVFRGAATTVDGFDGGRSVHGQFGSVEDWQHNAELRMSVGRALVARRDEWRLLAQTLLSSTRVIDETVHSLEEWACSQLTDLVDDAARAARVPDLSEGLAQAGLLPMFGFPTQVRLLHTAWPRTGEEPRTLDRDSDIAISEFAPGAQIVKDKAIHTAVGVVDFVQFPNGAWGEGSDPLGPVTEAGVCRSCLGITYDPVDSCPTCHSTAPEFSRLHLTEPVGYRTSFRARDYEQLDAPTARASQPRLSLPTGEYFRRDGNALLRSANAQVVAVNDNNGRLFSFAPAVRSYQGSPRATAGLIELNLLVDDDLRERARLFGHSVSGSARDPVAISAHRRTDVLVVGLDRVPVGLSISPTTASGRGAWASLGYLLRDAAVRWLDIGPDEVEVGVHPRLRRGLLSGEVFVADSLENGAGYASRLAARFEGLLDTADVYAKDLANHNEMPCDSSCHRCLRDYGNRAWHPLLDWRMATDLLGLLRGRPLDVRRQEDRDLRAMQAFASDFGFDVAEEEVPLLVGRSGQTLAVLHPFEDPSPESANARVLALRSRHPDAACTTSFDMIRRPGSLVGLLMGS